MGMTRGTVLALNRRRRTAVVGADDGPCSVIGSLADDHAGFNDVISGPLDSPGSQFLYNETRGCWFSAFLRRCGCSFGEAVREAG